MHKGSNVQIYTDKWNWFCVTVAYLHTPSSRSHLLAADKVALPFRSAFRKQKFPMAADSYLKYGQQCLIPTTKRYFPIVSGGGGNNWETEQQRHHKQYP